MEENVRAVIFMYAMACFLWSQWHAGSLQKLRLNLDMDPGAVLRSVVSTLGQGDALPRFPTALQTTRVAVMYSSTSQNRPIQSMQEICISKRPGSVNLVVPFCVP